MKQDLAKLDEAEVAYDRFGKVLDRPQAFVCGDDESDFHGRSPGSIGPVHWKKYSLTRSGVEDKEDRIPDLYDTKDIYICKHKVARPKVFIPVFPGTNCEYDTAQSL